MDDHSLATEEPLAPRRRLGRGLSALLGNRGSSEEQPQADLSEESDLQQIAVELIDRNPFQPREEFGEESLAELVASIGRHGMLQPVLVRRHGGRFQLIAGERRWLAAQQAGLAAIPCRIVERDDRGSTEAAIEENLKRKDLNPVEKARAFRDYRDRFGCSVEELAQKLSMQRSTVSNYLRLLELPDPVRESLVRGAISNGHARALLALDNPDDQIKLCRRIERESLSVRSTESEVKALQRGEADTIPVPQPQAEPSAAARAPETPGLRGTRPELTPHLRSLQEQLRQHLGAKVEIQLKSESAGRVVIPFASGDDFERILRLLRRAA